MWHSGVCHFLTLSQQNKWQSNVIIFVLLHFEQFPEHERPILHPTLLSVTRWRRFCSLIAIMGSHCTMNAHMYVIDTAVVTHVMDSKEQHYLSVFTSWSIGTTHSCTIWQNIFSRVIVWRDCYIEPSYRIDPHALVFFSSKMNCPILLKLLWS